MKLNNCGCWNARIWLLTFDRTIGIERSVLKPAEIRRLLLGKENLNPAVEPVIPYLGGLDQHGLESLEAPVPMLSRVKHIWRRHGSDLHAQFAKDANRAIHVKVACGQTGPSHTGRGHFFLRIWRAKEP